MAGWLAGLAADDYDAPSTSTSHGCTRVVPRVVPNRARLTSHLPSFRPWPHISHSLSLSFGPANLGAAKIHRSTETSSGRSAISRFEKYRSTITTETLANKTLACFVGAINVRGFPRAPRAPTLPSGSIFIFCVFRTALPLLLPRATRGLLPVTRPLEMTLPISIFTAHRSARPAIPPSLPVGVYARRSGRERDPSAPQWSAGATPASPFRMKGEKSRGASRWHCATCRCESACDRQRRHEFRVKACAFVTELFTYTYTAIKRETDRDRNRGIEIDRWRDEGGGGWGEHVAEKSNR